MRKRLISFALAAAIMVSASLPAFATKKFDMSVFDGKDYVGVVTDDMAVFIFVDGCLLHANSRTQFFLRHLVLDAKLAYPFASGHEASPLLLIVS